jgi:hypothetical protein
MPLISIAQQARVFLVALRSEGRSDLEDNLIRSALLDLFPGRARSALGGEAAHPRRGPPHGGEFRQAARTAARDAADKRSVTRRNRHASRQSAQCPLIVQLRKYRCIAASDVMGHKPTLRSNTTAVPHYEMKEAANRGDL